jgi:hypothetical protein
MSAGGVVSAALAKYKISGFWEIGRADSPFRALTGLHSTTQYFTQQIWVESNLLTNLITTPLHALSTITELLKAHSHLYLITPLFFHLT